MRDKDTPTLPFENQYRSDLRRLAKSSPICDQCRHHLGKLVETKTGEIIGVRCRQYGNIKDGYMVCEDFGKKEKANAQTA